MTDFPTGNNPGFKGDDESPTPKPINKQSIREHDKELAKKMKIMPNTARQNLRRLFFAGFIEFKREKCTSYHFHRLYRVKNGA